MEAGTRLVRIDELGQCVVAALESFGVPDDHAVQIADTLVDSDLRGYDDHGVSMLNSLGRYYQTGLLNARPNVQIVRETKGALLLDADCACGVIGATRAMQWCIERARELQGMAVAGVRNTNHFVAAAPYVAMAAEAGMIGFASSNAVPLLAPTGGRTRTFGTNPLAYGLPAGRHHPVVLDIASSAIAAAKIPIAAREGRSLPEGLLTDSAGRPSTDPDDFAKGGLMVPLGGSLAGHKGFGLSMVVDALAGVLTGASFAREAHVNGGKAGQTFWALDVEAFMPRDEFLARIDAQIDQAKASQRLEGVEEILVPGERSQRSAASLRERGTVPLSAATWDALASACQMANTPLPSATAA